MNTILINKILVAIFSIAGIVSIVAMCMGRLHNAVMLFMCIAMILVLIQNIKEEQEKL